MSPPWTQTMSMLVTDLVGSTAIADRIGPVATEELRTEYFGLLPEALDRSGGREVKNLGDGLMTVHMLDQAEDAAERAGAEGVMREVAECRSELAAIGSLNP